MRIRHTLSLVTLTLLSVAVSAFGQAGPGGGGGGFGGGGGGGGGANFQFDPSMISQMIDQRTQAQLDQIKTAMGSTDEEFAVMQPTIQKIMQAQFGPMIRQIGAMMRNISIAPNPNGNGPQIPPAMAATISQSLTNYNFGHPPSQLQTATADLQAAVDDPNSTPDVLTAKLAQVRAAREREDEDIAAAQTSLKPLLSVRQEAVLSLNGIMP